jgi:TetR/AcrR family transcriptional repressor of nem operon
MRVSREKAAEHRERIIEAASALFRAKGFDGIGVADIMKAADLTHGGFYGHFSSKDDLVTQSNKRTMTRAAENWSKITASDPKEPFRALLHHYLSSRHRDDPGRGCGFAALGNDVARSSKVVRKAFAEGLEPSLVILAEAISGKSKTVRRRKALTAMAALVGALMLARAAEGTALSDEMLDAVHRELLGIIEG